MPDFAVTTAFGVKDNLTAFFSGAEKGAGKFQSAVEHAFKESSHEAGIFKQMLGGITLGGLAEKGIEKGIEFIKDIPAQLSEIAEKGVALEKTSKIIGTNTDQLQRFDYAAKMSDVSIDSMQGALEKMNKGLGQLQVHQGPLESGLKRLNPQLMLQLRTAKDSQSAFLMVADAMAKTESPQKRAALATAVFGKAGQDLIPMLLKGREGMADLMKEADKYGAVLSESTIQSSEKFTDAMKKMDGSMQSLKYAAITPLLEAITPYIDKLVEWIAENKDLLAQDIKGFVTGAVQTLKELVPLIRTGFQIIKDWGPAILIAVGAFMALKEGMLAAAAASAIFETVNTVIFAFQAVAEGAATAQEALNLVMDANPIGAVITAVALLIGFTVLMIQHWNDAGGVFVYIKKTIMSMITLSFLPLLTVIDLVLRGLEATGKLFGANMEKAADFRKGMEGFVYQNTWLSGTKNGPAAFGDNPPQAGSTPALSGNAPIKASITDFLGSKDLPEQTTSTGSSARNAPNDSAVALQARIGGAQVYVDNTKADGVQTNVRTAQPIRSYQLGHNK